MREDRVVDIPERPVPMRDPWTVIEARRRNWHGLAATEALEALESRVDAGLSSNEAAARLKRVGPNELTEASRRGPMRILAAQFADVLVIVLIGAAIAAVAIGEPQDIVTIGAIVLLDAVFGFIQEYRAERAVAALRAMASPVARVRRDGAETTVPARELVPGDIVVLEAGNIVPADLRLLETNRLRSDESALTGESIAVDKTVRTIERDEVAIGDRRNLAFKGTTVTYGRGVGVVVATGMRTELGHVAALLGMESGNRTPLQQRLAGFGRILASGVLVLCAVIFAAGLLRGEPPALMFMTALSLAVAAIPEALPAVVTMALAFGAQKMARQRALVRRLPAVETLGSVTFVCSDKTGTLTENRMRVEVVDVDDRSRALMLEAMALNNDAIRDGAGDGHGDPTETALYRAAVDGGAIKERLTGAMPRVAEIPFSSERARMTTVHRVTDGVIAFTKGAPERVLPECSEPAGAASDGASDRQTLATLTARAERLAASGLRVLAFAMRRADAMPERIEDLEAHQAVLGFVGLVDPPRAGAERAVHECQTAGIRVVMITGDHRTTALAMARRLGIASDEGGVLTGPELSRLSSAELDARVRDVRVYARVAPEQKIRIVRALQRCGEYVAMTGDGVNDAPALKRADIGIAMGQSGMEVAREASHVVLLDDNFATIVNAVREGRRLYDNVRRFIRYSLSTNSGEIWTLFLAPFIGLPLPLLPIQILWMNLVTDGLPGLTLAAEPAARDIMRRPPRPPSESVFAHGLWQHAIWVGLLMAMLSLGTQAWAIHVGDAHWQSMTFTVLTLSQLAHVLAVRSERESLFEQGLFSNTPLLFAVTITVAAQLSTLYMPVLTRLLKTAPLTLGELTVCFALATVVFVAVEIEKWARRRVAHSKPGIASS